MKKIHLILLSILSGVLFTTGWPKDGIPVFLFIAFVPLLYMEDYIARNMQDFGRFVIFLYAFPAFFIWNLLTTYWIYNSTFVGAAMAIFLNSSFMSLVFMVFHLTRRNFPNKNHGYIALVFYWISFEYLHHHWDLNWPWLNLGNGFGAWHHWIQWYEYTGIFGGSAWVLIGNIIGIYFLRKIVNKNISIKEILIYSGSLVLWVAIPVIISHIIYNNYHETGKEVEVVVVQPNIDPYNEQYDLTPEQSLDRILSLAKKKVTPETKFVVAPESALQEHVWERNIDRMETLPKILDFVHRYNANFIVGISSRKLFEEDEEITPTARKFTNADRYYDAYNTALYVDSTQAVQTYHKSKLTPGVEKMPYPKVFKPLEKYAIDLGGTIGSLGIDKERIPFDVKNDSLKIAPVICYESVYGGFVSKFIKNGANFIFVITNDGWWGNTPGHRQHFLFSKLRAIELRRSVARSANTGISSFIDQRGDVYKATEYWVKDVIRKKITSNHELTFYAIYGDYIARVSIMGTVLMVLITITAAVKSKNSKLV
ncbi:MAG: apolipoprotein N-acyltransferase [Bacteroidales bacterium]|nr:apolipoprotein N-acyltransferase [Bacteroidales bacterium]